MKEDKYAKCICEIFWKIFCPIYEALYMTVLRCCVGVPLRGKKKGGRKLSETSVFEFSTKVFMNLWFEKLMKEKVIFILTRNV